VVMTGSAADVCCLQRNSPEARLMCSKCVRASGRRRLQELGRVGLSHSHGQQTPVVLLFRFPASAPVNVSITLSAALLVEESTDERQQTGR
jgi:hypothetical protein